MKIEVLYFEGCPNVRPAVERLKFVLQGEGVADEITEIEIEDEAAARKLQFPGSPTIRINGRDIDPDAGKGTGAVFACRRYKGGLPNENMIRRAVKEARARPGD